MTHRQCECDHISSHLESPRCKSIHSQTDIQALPPPNQETSEPVFCSEFEKKAKVLRRSLERLAQWEVPGKQQVEEYLRDMYRRNCSPRTFQGALGAIHTFLTCVRESGKTSVGEITKGDLEAFIEHEQDRGLMISSVKTKLDYASTFVRYLIDMELVSFDVLSRRIRLKLPDPLPRAIDPDDVQQLLSVINHTRDRAMIMVLLRTGMRIGELLNTKVQNVHIRDRRIDIYEGEKTRVGRVVYLSDDAMHALQAWLATRDSHTVFLFYARGKHAMSYSTAHQMFVDYLTKAGLVHKGHTLHSLRHTFASELLNAGMRIECLQPLMGHRSLDVTRRYARLTDKTREEEYFRAMSIIERRGIDGHYRCDHQVQTLLEEKKRLAQHG